MIPRYTPKDIQKIWSLENQYRTWLDIELAAVEAAEQQGLIPNGVYGRLEDFQLRSKLNENEIERIEAITKHDVIAFLTHLEELAGEDGKWIHFGLTSSDVVDTATSLNLSQALEALIERQRKLLFTLCDKAEKHIDTMMMGRSHGMHAEVTTFGYILTGHLMEFNRGLTDLCDANRQIRYGKISGAVGNYLNGNQEVEASVLTAFNLNEEFIATQVIPRDRHARVMNAIAIVGASLERLALTIRHLSRTEVGEVAESFPKGQKGSSAMPHKRNPIGSENICGLSRLLRAYSDAAMENIPLWHERDISHSSVERVIFADATSLLAYMQDRMTSIIENLVVNEKKMDENIGITQGLHHSEAVMLMFVRAGLGKKEAYEVVQSSAFKAMETPREFSFHRHLILHPTISGSKPLMIALANFWNGQKGDLSPAKTRASGFIRRLRASLQGQVLDDPNIL